MAPRSAAGPRWQFQSALEGLAWPAVHARADATVSALLFQLESSQWLPAKRLSELQFTQIEMLVRHAWTTVPYYREKWAGNYDHDAKNALTPARFAKLPLLTRTEVQARFEDLKSIAIPTAHGAVGEARSSGSTGIPIRILKTQLNIAFWKAFTLRDHAWHGRDLGARLASIRLGRAEGSFRNWGSATEGLLETGPCVVLSARHAVDTQLQWLQAERPDYLLTYPSIVRDLAKHSLESGTTLPTLREVRTFGELLTRETRELCKEAWNATVTDTYSAEEVGYMALQCPASGDYHVQSEGVLVEVLDDRHEPCAAGQVGRVVVTSLHNFAMPLIRYDVGDYAEVGGPCSCGRGLPVLKNIRGRVRNTLVTAAGKRYWPALGSRKFHEIAPVVQHQLVQKTLDLIEVRLVVAAALAPEQEDGLRTLILSELPPGFRLNFAYCESIARGAGGKFEDFVSEIA